MTPADDGFAALCTRLWPGFRATGKLLPARKSHVLPGELDGVQVIAKRLVRPNAVWQWYLEREIAIYRGFAATTIAVRAPRLIAAHERHGVLVIERLAGAPLAKTRHPGAELAAAAISALVAMRHAIATWPGAFPSTTPPAAVRSQLRRRLLEDPTAPVEWVRAGIARAAKLAILDDDASRTLDAAIAAYPITAACHGDLLLRNAIGDGERIGLVDWECAGPHLVDWDLALAWSQLGPRARGELEAQIVGDARRRAFLALGAFALVREISFVRAFKTRTPHAGVAALRDELAAVVARL